MATQAVRPPAVAGLFYPSDSQTLTAQVQALLAHALPPTGLPVPKALIVPHAGYIYSGPIAASAYAQLAPLRSVIRRVILLGPSHRVSFEGMALPGCSAFATPLGNLELDSDAVFMIAQHPGVVFDDRAHAQEHALEVQLPFLQATLESFCILPITLGQVSPTLVAEVLETVWGGPETLILVSSDLSHYTPYSAAQRDDRICLDQILGLDQPLSHEQACGATGINALMLTARRHDLVPTLLDLRNSGDTAGDRSRVVGYAAVSFAPAQHRTH
ncbi:MAG: AmmeMemoRadiSam system protein [Proteobacteria bacterium]|nr:AmmeMemoRadiSam system protein [Pseudomonadota bacterium]